MYLIKKSQFQHLLKQNIGYIKQQVHIWKKNLAVQFQQLSSSSSSSSLSVSAFLMLVQVSSDPSHLHMSVHGRLFFLQEHCLLQLLAIQEHLTSSTTASGAGGTLENTGAHCPSSSWLHPKERASGMFGVATRSWPQILACQCALRICSWTAPGVYNIFYFLPNISGLTRM